MKAFVFVVGIFFAVAGGLAVAAADEPLQSPAVIGAPEAQPATTCWKLIVGNGRPSGAGTVSKSPGPNCSFDYVDGTGVTLTAVPNAGFSFLSWNGACAGQGNPCVLTMNAHMTTSPNWQ